MGYNPLHFLLILLLKLSQTQGGSCFPSTIPIILWALPYLYLACPCLAISPFLQGTLVPFHGEWYLETKVWALKGTINLMPSQGLELGKNIYVCVHPMSVYTYDTHGCVLKHALQVTHTFTHMPSYSLAFQTDIKTTSAHWYHHFQPNSTGLIPSPSFPSREGPSTRSPHCIHFHSCFHSLKPVLPLTVLPLKSCSQDPPPTSRRFDSWEERRSSEWISILS